MGEVKIMASEKIMVMPHHWRVTSVLCACIMCGSEVFSTSKKIDDFFDAFFDVTSFAISNFV